MILGARVYTVTRPAEATWQGGRPIIPAPSTFDVEGSYQPLAGKEIALLPEGARSDAKGALLCDEFQTEIQIGDRVAIGSSSFLVIGSGDWMQHDPLPYRSYVLGEVTSA